MTSALSASERHLRGKRFALFEPNPDFATNPTLVQLASSLLRCGAEVDLIMPPAGAFPDVALRARRWAYAPSLDIRDLLGRRGLRMVLRRLSGTLLRALCRFGYYDVVIGIDPAGIVDAHGHVARGTTPLVYLSFEIFFEDELCSDEERDAKRRERVASRAAAVTIVQDERRGALLARENRISQAPMLYVPVAPAREPRAPDTRFWHRRYGLAESDVVVLHSGSFAPWTYADELLRSTKHWDPRFVLVVHSRFARPEADARSDRAGRVIFSSIPAPASAYDEMVASADIGLVLYKACADSKYSGKNLENIGLASGKLAFYAKYGLPVVTVGQRSLGELFTKHGCGINVDDFNAMPVTLCALVTDRVRYAAGMRALFETICFDAHWPALAAALAGLARERRVTKCSDQER
jgi:glycosyltransferase involved in cell wall biosynthesis